MEHFSGDGMSLYFSFLVEAKSWTVAILIPAEIFFLYWFVCCFVLFVSLFCFFVLYVCLFCLFLIKLILN